LASSKMAPSKELQAAQAQVNAIDEEISRLEGQLRHARDAATAAGQRLADVTRRQDELAIDIVSGSEEAAKENEELEQVVLIESRRRATANSAVTQLRGLIEEQRAARKEAVKGVEAARAAEKADVARELAKTIDERLEGLGEVLDSIVSTMEIRRQMQLKAGLVPDIPTAGIDVSATLKNYLVQRMGPRWAGDTLPHGYHYPRTLAQASYLERASRDDEESGAV
jgi:chromosome segregation ATPase